MDGSLQGIPPQQHQPAASEDVEDEEEQQQDGDDEQQEESEAEQEEEEDKSEMADAEEAGVREGVAKLLPHLRKAFAQQHEQRAAEAAASNAARLRRLLEAQAAAREGLLARLPALALAQRLGGLPSAAERDARAEPFDRTRQAAAQWRCQLKRKRGAAAAGRQDAEAEERQSGASGSSGQPMQNGHAGEVAQGEQGQQEEGEDEEQGEEEGLDPQSLRPVPVQLLVATTGVLNYMGGKGQPLQAFVLPTIAGLPPFKTWIHIRGNVVSKEVGKRMFYTDEKGETVPVSDDEAELEAQQWDQHALNGTQRLMHEYVIQELTAQFGTVPAVFKALESLTHISAGALEARALALAAEEAGQLPYQQRTVWADKPDLDALEADIYGTWCRRCRVFGCPLHKGAHPRPVLGPVREEPTKAAGRGRPPLAQQRSLDPAEAAAGLPCGPHCYLCPPQAAQAPRGGASSPVRQQQDGEQEGQGQQQQGQQQQREAVSYASSPVPAPLPAQHLPVPGSGLLSLKRRRRVSDPRQQPLDGQGQQQQQQDEGEQQQANGVNGSKGWEQAAVEQEVNSPPAKQRKHSPPPVQPPQGTANGAAAAAAAAAAANVPARRRGSSSRGGGWGGEAAAGGGAAANGVAHPFPPADDEEWNAWEESALQQGLEVWGWQPCKVALLVGTRTCRQVQARMQRLQDGQQEQQAAGEGAGEEGEDAGEEGAAARRWRGRKMAKAQIRPRRKPQAVYERAKRTGPQWWGQYHPCECQGPCKADCPCTGDANFCEKFCACDPAKCGNRFPGCTCKAGTVLGRRCTSKQCPCLAAGRECDPDLCKGCKPTLTGEHKEGWQCNNFRIRLGQKKRVLMGLSDIQGWGAFLQQAAQKDEYVGEYCGELIGHEEADRRGIVYDRDDNSYLFDLNKEYVIDARQHGNALRFANHSANANCRAQVLTVDGDHRVAIVASRDVAAGEECFYNYNYDKRVAPDWAVTEREWGEARPAHVAKKRQAGRRNGSRGSRGRGGGGGSGGGGGGAGGEGSGGGGGDAGSDSSSSETDEEKEEEDGADEEFEGEDEEGDD